MSHKSKLDRTAEEAFYTKLIAGITQHITSPILVNGHTYTPDDLKAPVQAALTADQDLDAARRDFDAKVAARKEVMPPANRMIKVFKTWLLGSYGPTNPIVTELGFEAPKPRVTPVASKAAGIEKSKATRVARGTKGSRQKKNIHGAGTPGGGSAPKA